MDMRNEGTTNRNGIRSRARSGASGLVSKAAVLAGLVLFAACTSTQSQIETADQSLPAPQVVVVTTFAASPDEVHLDKTLSSEVEQAIKDAPKTSRTDEELKAGRQVVNAIADKLAVEIRDMGLTAERGGAVPSDVHTAVLIDGQLVSVDEGSRAERVIIGLGAGRSDVRVHVQVYEVTAAGRRLIDTIEVDGKSGLTPGMAETMGAGALAGHVLVSAAVGTGIHVAAEDLGTDVVADADRAAKGIAKQLAILFAKQGWVAP